MEAAESDRRRYHQSPARPGALALGGAFGLLDIGKDTPDPFQIARADIGQGHGARGPLQQPRAETLLQCRDRPGHPRGRQAELAGRGRKTLQIRNRDKGLHGIETVHRDYFIFRNNEDVNPHNCLNSETAHF